MRLSRRKILIIPILGIAGAMTLPGAGHADGDLIESWLSNVSIIEYGFERERIKSLRDRQSPNWRKAFIKLFSEFALVETRKYPILNNVEIREYRPADPWSAEALRVGVSVSVTRLNENQYVGALFATYRRVSLLKPEKPPQAQSDFHLTYETRPPTGFVLSRAEAEDPERLAFILFEIYKIQLADDIRRIAEIREIWGN